MKSKQYFKGQNPRFAFLFILFYLTTRISLTEIKIDNFKPEKKSLPVPPTFEVRALLQNCPSDHFPKPEDCCTNFVRESDQKTPNVINCKKKLVITLKIINVGITDLKNQYVVVDYVFNPNSEQKQRLLYPYVLKIKQKSIMQTYRLKYEGSVNEKAREIVYEKKTKGYKECSTGIDSTCGKKFYQNNAIPFSDGFCCSCDNLKGTPTHSLKNISFHPNVKLVEFPENPTTLSQHSNDNNSNHYKSKAKLHKQNSNLCNCLLDLENQINFLLKNFPLGKSEEFISNTNLCPKQHKFKEQVKFYLDQIPPADALKTKLAATIYELKKAMEIRNRYDNIFNVTENNKEENSLEDNIQNELKNLSPAVTVKTEILNAVDEIDSLHIPKIKFSHDFELNTNISEDSLSLCNLQEKITKDLHNLEKMDALENNIKDYIQKINKANELLNNIRCQQEITSISNQNMPSFSKSIPSEKLEEFNPLIQTLNTSNEKNDVEHFQLPLTASEDLRDLNKLKKMLQELCTKKQNNNIRPINEPLKNNPCLSKHEEQNLMNLLENDLNTSSDLSEQILHSSDDINDEKFDVLDSELLKLKLVDPIFVNEKNTPKSNVPNALIERLTFDLDKAKQKVNEVDDEKKNVKNDPMLNKIMETFEVSTVTSNDKKDFFTLEDSNLNQELRNQESINNSVIDEIDLSDDKSVLSEMDKDLITDNIFNDLDVSVTPKILSSNNLLEKGDINHDLNTDMLNELDALDKESVPVKNKSRNFKLEDGGRIEDLNTDNILNDLEESDTSMDISSKHTLEDDDLIVCPRTDNLLNDLDSSDEKYEKNKTKCSEGAGVKPSEKAIENLLNVSHYCDWISNLNLVKRNIRNLKCSDDINNYKPKKRTSYDKGTKELDMHEILKGAELNDEEKKECEQLTAINVDEPNIDGPNLNKYEEIGIHPRSELNCLDISNYLNVNPKTYQTSSHCLTFSNLWYSVYKLEQPVIDHYLEVEIFEKHEDLYGHVIWRDVTNGVPLRLGTFISENSDGNQTIWANYVQSDPTQSNYAINHELNRLLVPEPLPSLYHNNYPELQGGPSEYLVIPNDLIALNGSACDKIGVGYEAFAKQPKRCEMPRGTCLKNQPRDFWHYDHTLAERGLPGLYFLKYYASIPENPIFNSTNGLNLTLYYRDLHEATLNFELRADHNFVIRPHASAVLTEVYVDSTNYLKSVITGKVTNNGLIHGVFSLSITDCPLHTPASFNSISSKSVMIAPQKQHVFYLEILCSLPKKKFYCSLEVRSAQRDLLAFRRIRFQQFDRCICIWHCRCTCLEADGGLTCQYLPLDHYNAAGFQGGLDVVSQYVEYTLIDELMTLLFNLFLTMTILLLFMGFLKAILGIFYASISVWGLDTLLGLPKPLCKYYEESLRCYKVQYDREGWPIHPSTRSRVRDAPLLIEFCLNLIFFLIYPLIIIHIIVKRVIVPKYTNEKVPCNECGNNHLNFVELCSKSSKAKMKITNAGGNLDELSTKCACTKTCYSF